MTPHRDIPGDIVASETPVSGTKTGDNNGDMALRKTWVWGMGEVIGRLTWRYGYRELPPDWVRDLAHDYHVGDVETFTRAALEGFEKEQQETER